MSTKSITGTGLLLAVALLAQSLRLMFPFIPNQVSMFLIGSITSATFVLATWRYGWKNGLVIAWICLLYTSEFRPYYSCRSLVDFVRDDTLCSV